MVTLVLGLLFVRRRTRTLGIACAVATLLTVVFAAPDLLVLARGDFGPAGAATESPIADLATGEPDVLAAVGRRFLTWLFLVGAGAIGWIVSPQILLGFWAALAPHPGGAREAPQAAVVDGGPGHPDRLAGRPALGARARRCRARTARGDLGRGGRLTVLRDLTGLAGGLGYVALFGLVAAHLSARGRRNRAVVAVGRRSLSSYLAHSLIFAPVLAAWGLGLGAELGSAGMLLFAVGVWLVTVVAAYALERRGLPGPAEKLLRRLTYPRGG